MAKRGPYAKSAERRDEILDSALAVIAERGFHGATLRAVGRELGIEPAHIIYHFGSREGLVRAVIERWDADNDPNLAGVDIIDGLAHSVRRNQRLRGVVQMFLAFAVEAVPEDHPAHDYYRHRYRAAIEGTADAVRAGQASGAIRPELDPERVGRRLMALADGLQLQWLLDPDFDPVAELEAEVDDLFVDPSMRKRAAED